MYEARWVLFVMRGEVHHPRSSVMATKKKSHKSSKKSKGY